MKALNLDIIIKPNNGASHDAPFFIAVKQMFITLGLEYKGVNIILHSNQTTTARLKRNNACLLVTAYNTKDKRLNGACVSLYGDAQQTMVNAGNGILSALSAYGIHNLSVTDQKPNFNITRLLSPYKRALILYCGYPTNRKDYDIITNEWYSIGLQIGKELEQ